PSAEPDTLYSHDGILRGFKYLNKDSILFFNDRNHIILANAKGETELLDIFHKNIKFLNYSQGHIVLIDTEGSLYLFDFVKGTWFKPFKNQSIKKALFDQDGSLVCVSNSTGLLLVPQIKAQSYTYDGGYDFRNAYAIYAKDEHIWLGTQRSTVHKINRSGTIETRAINDRKLSNIINVIKEVNDEVYIGSERTIIRLREDGNEEEYEVHALKDFEVFENDLIVAQFNGIRRIPLDSREKIDTLFEERCFATVKLSEEQMLFHAKSGLYTYTLSSNKVEEFACNEDFSNQRITEIEFVNGTLLFGTNGAGLWVFDGKTMRKFKKKDGLCDNFIYDIHLDNLENIWLATSNGVNQISLRQRQVNVIKHFDTSDGLLNAFCHRIYGTQDKIYVTGPEGLSILNVEQDVDRIFIGQKKIVFGKVKVNNAYVACADLNEVQPGSQIEIPFSFSSIAHAHDFIYEYKEAKDNDFKVLGGNVLELLDLNGRSEPYEYTVRLNYKGKALPETVNSISFTMKPFWYERAWLQILFTIMALSFLFYLIFKRIQKDRLQKERALEIKNQLTQLEMQALQAQFNPHFVHNVLNAIQNFVLKNQPEDAYNYITNFSRLMRNYLNATDDHFISLEREFEMMENYIKLEQIRLPGKFEYKIEFEEGLDASDILIPSMIIQPYIENAIHHGLAHKKQKGLLQLTISKDEEGFKLSVIDNGIGRRAAGEIMANKEKLRKSFGVKIISDRIELFNKLYDQTIHVKIIDLNDTRTGTHVIISIPNLE
ncbi:MAG: histidine kinase, partial [Bacteroidota bacterium]